MNKNPECVESGGSTKAVGELSSKSIHKLLVPELALDSASGRPPH